MYLFGDSFDLYGTTADVTAGYWDSAAGTLAFVAGRFLGSQAANFSASGSLTKSSGSNDAAHHVNLSFQQSAALSGTTLGNYITLFDGSTAQCSIVFRSDGAVLLTSGGPTGSVLATWPTAVVDGAWYAYEFEVVINASTGSFAGRKSGHTSNDFQATGLNTAPSGNAYAGKITIGKNAAIASQLFDDVLWRSDPSSVSWAGALRVLLRQPVSDAQAQWTASGKAFPQSGFPGAVYSNTDNITAGRGVYMPAHSSVAGAVTSCTLHLKTTSTANFKGAVYSNSSSGYPQNVLATSSVATASGLTVTFTFPTPATVVAQPSFGDASFWFAYDPDTTNGTFMGRNSGFSWYSTTAYATFPATITGGGLPGNIDDCAFDFTVVAPSVGNYSMVAENFEDGLTTYNSSATVAQADLYGVGQLYRGVAASVFAVVTRAFCQKSDSGARSISVDIKRSSALSTGSTTALNTAWGWMWRIDQTDPSTLVQWTPSAVDNMQIGMTLQS